MRPSPVGEGETFHLRLTLLQGKYHQVKRMVAAVSNRVEGLHRSQIGRLTLARGSGPGSMALDRRPRHRPALTPDRQAVKECS